MAHRLLVTRALSIDPRAVLEPLLGHEGRGYVLDQWEDDLAMPRAALLQRVHEADALVCTLAERVDAELLGAAQRLRVVANHAAGVDNLDLAACAARGVICCNTPGVLTDATADLALALLLAVARRLREGEALVRGGGFHGWSPRMLPGLELRGATLGVVGFGAIGRAVAQRARAFGMEILYSARTPAPPEVERALGARRAELGDLLAQSDAVTLHCPLTPETRHLINAAALAQMKRGAILINTARGPVVDEAALADSLRRGWLGGAGLDVHEREPLAHPALLGRDDVVLLPHLGSATWAARRRMAESALTDAARVLRGEPPRHPVA